MTVDGKNLSGDRERWQVNNQDWNRLRGRCTGLLDCCIAFFSTTRMDDIVVLNKARSVSHPQIHPGYVTCPECWTARRFVTPLKCRPGCLCAGTLPAISMGYTINIKI